MNVSVADFTLIYNGSNITSDISSQVLSVEYGDRLTGASDELSIVLEDTDKRWQNGWYPTKGDTMQLYLRQDGQQMNCGEFEVDEPELNVSTSGDIFTVKGLGAGIRVAIRTRNSYAHSDKTLAEIANTVGAGLGLTLLGTVPNIAIHRAHQLRETDLSFLNRIGAEYGCIFSIRGKQLVFTHYQELQARNPSITLNRTDIISASMKDTTHKTFKSCRVRHHDPLNKVVIEDEEDEDDPDLESGSDDVLELHTRVENNQQAKSKAQYALFKNNVQGVGGDITVPGNLLLLAGNNVQVNQLGNYSGIFQIRESKHSLTRQGAYTTSINIQRVKKIDPVNYK